MDTLLYCINTVAPIFLLVALGQVFLRIGLLDRGFFDRAERFVFKVALPCNLFLSVYGSDASEGFDFALVLYCLGCIAVSVALPCLFVPLFIKENGTRGAFVQGIFRSNFAILGLPLAIRLFPENGGAVAASVMPFAIIPFNALAVVVLTVFSTKGERTDIKATAKSVLCGIVKNPLIIGILLGLPFMLTSLRLPTVIYDSVEYMSVLTTPLALMSLGAGIRLDRLKGGRLRLAFTAAVIKTALLPAVFVTVAALIGFRGAELGTVFILFGAPSAVSGYVMAKNMGSDHELAGQILLLSTLMCVFTVFAGVYILRSIGII